MYKQKITPVLRILDVSKAKEFYIDWLGFKIDWEHRFGEDFPLYMQISKEDIILHLTEHYGDAIPGANIRIDITGIEQFCRDLKPYRYYKPAVERQEWGANEICLLDPFGNHITFTEPAPANPSNG